MAVQPLFVSSIDVLKAKLRLTGSTAGDTQTILETQIELVRSLIYDELGPARVTQISQIAYVANGTTEEQLLRTKANLLETIWVRMLCLRVMPQAFIDGSGITQQRWNQDGILRDSPPDGLRNEISRLETEIARLLAGLADETEDQSSVRAESIGPDTVLDRPSIFPFNRFEVL